MFESVALLRLFRFSFVSFSDSNVGIIGEGRVFNWHDTLRIQPGETPRSEGTGVVR